jgi:ribosomal subunit interface protein
MRVTVSVRHCSIADELRQRAEQVVDRLVQRTPFAQDATVVFDAETLSMIAEIRIRLAGGEVLVATGDGDDHRTALDRAEARIRRQLEKPAARPRRGA